MGTIWKADGKAAEDKGLHPSRGRTLPVPGHPGAIFVPRLVLQLESFQMRLHHAGSCEYRSSGKLLQAHREAGDAVSSMLGPGDDSG